MKEVAVVGVPDERWGEAVKAVVLLREGAECSESEILEFCRNKLAAFKQPKSISFVETLPKNITGKILKAELRERYKQASGAPHEF